MDKKQKSHIRPIIYVMISVFLIIGYAYLTSSLTINGVSLLKKATWDVHFENIQVKDGSVTGEQVTQEPEIDTNKTTVNFHVNLKKPGDYYEFTVDAVNAGTIDAMINSYTEFDLTEDQLKYLETSVTYEDGEEIQEKQQLLAGDFAVYKIVVSFKKDLEADDLPGSPDQLDLEFTVEYVQKDDTSIQRRAENTLYNVLKNEYEKNGYAKLYTGVHQDNIDSSKSVKKIYYYNNTKTYDIATYMNKFNVRFGGYCWIMLRTTDTGGVKLLYNGEPSNGLCETGRAKHSGYDGSDNIITLSGNYYYSSSYVFDSSTSKYSLDGNIIQANWNDSNYSDLIGKYTCKSTSPTATCSTMYLIYSYYDSTKSKAISLSNSALYTGIGSISYNDNKNSYSSLGYMNDNKNADGTSIGVAEEKMTNNFYLPITSFYLSDYSYYSDTYTLSDTSYYLVDPVKVNRGEGSSELVGKYMIRGYGNSDYIQGSFGSQLCYVLSASSNSVSVLLIKDGKTLENYSPIFVSDSYSITNNNYVLNNYNEYDILSYYNNDYNNVLGKFVCGDYTEHECPNLLYITKSDNISFRYITVNNNILIGKRRNGLKLQDTIVIDRYQWFRDKDNYSDYIYTCGNLNDICTKNDLVIFDSFTEYGFNYSPYRFYGSGVSWDGEKYSLVDPIEFESYNDLNTLSYHHYFCLDYGETQCSSVAYMVYYNGTGDIEYLLLENGKTLNETIEQLLTSNTKDSLAKFAIDKWFEKNLIQYSSYLDDTIFCGDRNIISFGSLDPDGGYPTVDISFNHSNDILPSYISKDYFACNKITDRFSVSNDYAKLKYSVALITKTEINMLGETNALAPVYTSFITMSPAGRRSIYYASMSSGGGRSYPNWKSTLTCYGGSIRPVIALKKGIVITSGNGSQSSPYYIKTEYDG